jgi:hypothetical protein
LQVAKMVLHDWQRGRLPYFVPPPKLPQDGLVSKTSNMGIEQKLHGIPVAAHFNSAEEGADSPMKETASLKEEAPEDLEVRWEDLEEGGAEEALAPPPPPAGRAVPKAGRGPLKAAGRGPLKAAGTKVGGDLSEPTAKRSKRKDLLLIWHSHYLLRAVSLLSTPPPLPLPLPSGACPDGCADVASSSSNSSSSSSS